MEIPELGSLHHVVAVRPCPALLAWSLENPIFQRFNGTRLVLDRLALRPGQHVLEIGPGPGRLLLPAANQVLPDGEAVGIDIQPAMIKRLEHRAVQAGITNLKAILGDAAQPHVPEATFDIVFLCAALGEIPDRSAALAQAYRTLKRGGVLSITEMFGDPHYQSRSVVERLALEAGFPLQSVQGGWWLFTADFIKPAARERSTIQYSYPMSRPALLLGIRNQTGRCSPW